MNTATVSFVKANLSALLCSQGTPQPFISLNPKYLVCFVTSCIAASPLQLSSFTHASARRQLKEHQEYPEISKVLKSWNIYNYILDFGHMVASMAWAKAQGHRIRFGIWEKWRSIYVSFISIAWHRNSCEGLRNIRPSTPFFNNQLLTFWTCSNRSMLPGHSNKMGLLTDFGSTTLRAKCSKTIITTLVSKRFCPKCSSHPLIKSYRQD